MIKVTRLIAALAFMFGNASIANSANFTFSGDLTYHNDIVQVDFTIANATDVSLYTDSFGYLGLNQFGNPIGTNFDPIATLWDADGNFVAENDDLAPDNGRLDAGILSISLEPGTYSFTVGAYDNFPKGDILSDGFSNSSDLPIKIKDWIDILNNKYSTNNLGGSFWKINLEGVDSATLIPTSAVPLPGALWMFGSGLIGFIGFARNNRRVKPFSI
jgi:hypothetical protein